MKGFELWGGLLKVSLGFIEVAIPHTKHHTKDKQKQY